MYNIIIIPGKKKFDFNMKFILMYTIATYYKNAKNISGEETVIFIVYRCGIHVPP